MEFIYNLLFLLHLSTVVVGFGSSFVWPFLAARSRQLATAEGYAVNKLAFDAGKVLTTPMIWLAGLFGVLMLGVAAGADDGSAVPAWSFSDTWVSIAFVLFFVAAALAAFVHTPNLRAMLALQEKLAAGEVTPSAGGPPAEVAELAARGKRAGMIGGILHLLWLLLMIDMIWKPGI